MKVLLLIIAAGILVTIWHFEVQSILEEMEGDDDEESTEDDERR